MTELSRDFFRFCSFIMSHDLAKCESHGSCENGYLVFFICHVILVIKYLVTLRVGPLIVSLIRLRSIGLTEVEIMAPITFPIPIPFPMPRFSNG